MNISGNSTPQPASTSSTTPQFPYCPICTIKFAIYTCPRCSTKYCSVACSKAHQQTQLCNSTRERGSRPNSNTNGNGNGGGKYIPMKEYDYMSFVDDYVFLEEIGRKVSDWGREIQNKHLADVNDLQKYAPTATANPNSKKAVMHMKGMNMNSGHHQKWHGKTRREILKERLEEFDIELMLLPNGMHRRKTNQSTWDTKANKGFMTIEYRFRKSLGKENETLDKGKRTLSKGGEGENKEKEPSTNDEDGLDSVETFLSHRNELHMSLRNSLERIVSERSQKQAFPTWIRELVLEGRGRPPPTTSGTDASTSTDPTVATNTSLTPTTIQTKMEESNRQYLLLIPVHRSRLRPQRRSYASLDPDTPLTQAFKGQTIVEYPTIEVVDRTQFFGTLVGPDDKGEGDGDETKNEGYRIPFYQAYMDYMEVEEGEMSDGSTSSSSDRDNNKDHARGDENEDEREYEARRKRRKIDPEGAQRLMAGLMDYGDDSDQDDDDQDDANDANDADNKKEDREDMLGSVRDAKGVKGVAAAAAAAKPLGVLQMLDYGNDESSEDENDDDEDEGDGSNEEKDVKNGASSHSDNQQTNTTSRRLPVVDHWEEEAADWGED